MQKNQTSSTCGQNVLEDVKIFYKLNFKMFIAFILGLIFFFSIVFSASANEFDLSTVAFDSILTEIRNISYVLIPLVILLFSMLIAMCFIRKNLFGDLTSILYDKTPEEDNEFYSDLCDKYEQKKEDYDFEEDAYYRDGKTLVSSMSLDEYLAKEKEENWETEKEYYDNQMAETDTLLKRL